MNTRNQILCWTILPRLVLACLSCNNVPKPPITNLSAVQDSCPGVPRLNWQKESYGVSDSTASKLIANIQAAAQSDVAHAKAGATVNSELAQFVRQNIQQSSSVSQDFWQQDITYREIICLYNRNAQDTAFPIAIRQKFAQAILDLNQARADYMLEVKKKDQQ